MRSGASAILPVVPLGTNSIISAARQFFSCLELEVQYVYWYPHVTVRIFSLETPLTPRNPADALRSLRVSNCEGLLSHSEDALFISLSSDINAFVIVRVNDQ